VILQQLDDLGNNSMPDSTEGLVEDPMGSLDREMSVSTCGDGEGV